METFEHKLQRPSATTSGVTEKPPFDIGRFVQTHSMGGWNNEALSAYNFLRFCEDAGIPFRVAGCTIATKSGAGTLTRIAEYSSYWALATLVRIGDPKVVNEIFDRPSLARMDLSTVDSSIERYLESLQLAASDIETGDRRRGPNFGTLLAGVLPEVLSRLCCKCSQGAREQLFDWLLEVYRSEHRSNYQGIGTLTRRLLEAFPVRERVAMVPTLLEFPILTVRNIVEEREYPNPFDFLDIPPGAAVNVAKIPDTAIEVFLNGTSSDESATRRQAVSTLGTLYDFRLLKPVQSQKFAEGLWSRVDEHGLPSGTSYYRFAFLSLPHPTGIDPVESFTRYVRGTQFPAQESQTRTTVEVGGDPGVPLCRNILAAEDVQWAKGDVQSIVTRLVHWWNADKAHWLRAQVKGPSPSIAPALGRRLSDMVRTLAAMVVRYPGSLDEEDIRSAVTRVAEECSEYDVPAVRLEVACAYAFAAPRDPVLHRVENAMASPRTNPVIDALGAMDMVSHRAESDSDKDDLMQLLRAAGQMIRWRRETALWATLKAVGDVVKRHPWTFAGDVELSVLAGLGLLVTETAVGGENGGAIDGVDGDQDVSRKLVVRRAAARLAYRLFKHYRALGEAIPDAVKAWRTVCGSDSEFLDIRNEWPTP